MLFSAASPDPIPAPVGATTVTEPGLYGWWLHTTEQPWSPPAADTCQLDAPLATEGPGLVVLDVDSTLITAEQIELLAAHAGAQDAVAMITERAMRGELDFAASLAERVATLAGVPLSALAAVAAELQLAPGARELLTAIHNHGGRVALVSGGFAELVEPLAADLGVDAVTANRLETSRGVLTGRTQGPVVDRAAKARELQTYAVRFGVPPARVVAIGDGANDLDMLAVAGLGIAYCAKPVLTAAADAAISFPRLDAARIFLGLTDEPG